MINGCVVYFEAFQGDDRQLLAKEPTIVNMEHGLSCVIFIKPPYNCTLLNSKHKYMADYQGRPEGGGQKGQIVLSHKILNSKGGHIRKKKTLFRY